MKRRTARSRIRRLLDNDAISYMIYNMERGLDLSKINIQRYLISKYTPLKKFDSFMMVDPMYPHGDTVGNVVLIKFINLRGSGPSAFSRLYTNIDIDSLSDADWDEGTRLSFKIYKESEIRNFSDFMTSLGVRYYGSDTKNAK